MGPNVRDDAVIRSAFLTQAQWLRGCGHLYAVVAVPHKELQLTFATCNELTSQVLVWVLANVERKQDRERLVRRDVSLSEKRIECSVKCVPRRFRVARAPHVCGGAKDDDDPCLN
jgi:hypothetical protein